MTNMAMWAAADQLLPQVVGMREPATCSDTIVILDGTLLVSGRGMKRNQTADPAVLGPDREGHVRAGPRLRGLLALPRPGVRFVQLSRTASERMS